jgi:muramoyltetrapeptide carboxypeptidase
MEMIRPRRLPAGGRIGVAALSGHVDPARLEAGLAHLVSCGFSVAEARNLRSAFGRFAGSDLDRAKGYMELVEDPDVDAIFFSRGGWGAARALPHIDPDIVRRHPKIQMGGSDLTSLFAFLGNRAALVTFYGPMVAVDFARRPVEPHTDASWRETLAGEVPPRTFKAESVLVPGRGAGRLVGGCLSLLIALEGTPDAMETDGAILFWEDVGEELYRIDRMLTQLSRAGRLECLSGAIIGRLDRMTNDRRDDPAALTDLLRDHFGSATYPVVRDWPAGHGVRNEVLPLGAMVSIDTETRTFRFEEEAVW